MSNAAMQTAAFAGDAHPISGWYFRRLDAKIDSPSTAGGGDSMQTVSVEPSSDPTEMVVANKIMSVLNFIMHLNQ